MAPQLIARHGTCAKHPTMQPEAQPPTLRLGEFILTNLEPILSDWETFARNSWEGPMPGVVALRNDAEVMLKALVTDMASEQTLAQQKAKSEGAGVGDASGLNRAAMGHALARVNDGFDIRRMVAEFRALRASVSRLWFESLPVANRDQIDDMGRFNEALDQLVAASVTVFTQRIDHSREMFLGILGHDLRQPLFSIKMYSDVLLRSDPPADTRPIVAGISRCSDAMAKLLSDLLDFTSSRLGCPMPVYPSSCNIGVIANEVVEELRASAPDTEFNFEAEGNLDGTWDPTRLRQLVSNLLANAIQHGAPNLPITITVHSSGEDVTLSVHNQGKPIPPDAVGTLFDPMVRAGGDDKPRPHGSIGLGLYICRQIVLAHKGKIDVESHAKAGTTFEILLPKHFSAVRPES